MKIVIDIPEDDYRDIKKYYKKNDYVEAAYIYIYHGIPLNEVLNKIIDEINAEMRKMYMFRDYTNGLANAFEIIDKYTKGESE